MLTVVSGGQTGADFAGLVAARRFGVPTGGWTPANFRTSLGPRPVLGTRFGLKAHASPLYPPRTELNVKASTVTLVLSSEMQSAGTVLTIKLCKQHDVPHYSVLFDPSENIHEQVARAEQIPKVLATLRRHELLFGDPVLNVAGNATNNSSRIFDFAYAFCCKLLAQWLSVPELTADQLNIEFHQLRDNYERFEQQDF